MSTNQMLGDIVPEFSQGDRLRKARIVTGLTVDEFAERAGLSAKTVTNYEGSKVKPRKSGIIAWSWASGVSLQWLITGQGAPSNDGGDDGNPVTDEYLPLPAAPVTSILSGLHVHSQPRLGLIPQAA